MKKRKGKSKSKRIVKVFKNGKGMYTIVAAL
jgi:hypothetical protein